MRSARFLRSRRRAASHFTARSCAHPIAAPRASDRRAAPPTHSEMRIATAAVGAFLGWAFQGVGPSRDARWALVRTEPEIVPGLGLLFGSDPTLALYCGAKVRRESYAPLSCKSRQYSAAHSPPMEWPATQVIVGYRSSTFATVAGFFA